LNSFAAEIWIKPLSQRALRCLASNTAVFSPSASSRPSEIGLVSGQPRLKLSSEQAIPAIVGAYLPKLHSQDAASFPQA
jgi:hypothetical protein